MSYPRTMTVFERTETNFHSVIFLQWAEIWIDLCGLFFTRQQNVQADRTRKGQ